jgi:hypothetical protein
MTAAVRHILDSFDALPEPERHVAAVEILRRVSASCSDDLLQAALLEAANGLFLALDEEEAWRSQMARSSRLQAILKAARERIEAGKGIREEDFWADVEKRQVNQRRKSKHKKAP